MSLRDSALSFAKNGYRVFPIRPRGKVPLTPNGHKDASKDVNQVRAWWNENPDANIGLVCGDGLAVLDVDGQRGVNSLRELLKEHGKLATLTAKTGGGGLHLYLKDDPENPLSQTVGLAPGLDTRAGGKGYVVAPPSMHPNGTKYAWWKKQAMAEVPSWLRALADKPRGSAPGGTGEMIPEGSRNNVLASIGGSLRAQGMSAKAIEAALLEENLERCITPLPEDEVKKIAASVSRYEPNATENLYVPDASDEFDVDEEANPAPAAGPGLRVTLGTTIDFTDEWAVHQILPELEDELRYVAAKDVWFIWDEYRWVQDPGLRAELKTRDLLKRLSLQLEARADNMSDQQAAKPLRAAARRYQSANGIRNIFGLLRAHMICAPEDFDTKPMKLNTPEGVVDLKTGEIVEGRPDDMHSRATSVAPEKGKPKLWLRFLGDLTGGDQELIDYLQELTGYWLTGAVSEKILNFIWGSNSDTGKSTFIKTVELVMDSYADSVDASAFINTRSDRIPDDIARLPGIRLVTANEPAAGQSWDEKTIKTITGGDQISARKLHGSWFTYRPQFKIAIVGNHEPEISNVDDAMLRRIHIVPMNRKVPREKQVDRLAEKMFEREGPQILNWFLEGTMRWHEEGITVPTAVQAATEDYAAEEETVAQFLREECETGEDYQVSRRAMYQAWRQWCNARGEEPGGLKSFRRKVKPHADNLGVEDRTITTDEGRPRGYVGIRLRRGVEFPEV